MKSKSQNNWLNYVAVVMLLGAIISYFTGLFALPYAYYQLMNWAIVGAALTIVWQSYKMSARLPLWLFALVAVIFNPITPIYLGALTWQIADMLAVIVFVVSFFLMKAKEN